MDGTGYKNVAAKGDATYLLVARVATTDLFLSGISVTTPAAGAFTAIFNVQVNHGFAAAT
jgi:hypothetical protein